MIEVNKYQPKPELLSKADKTAVEINTIVTAVMTRLTTENSKYLGKQLFKYMTLGLPLHGQIAHAMMDDYRHCDDILKTNYRVFMRVYMNGAFTPEVLNMTKERILGLHQYIMIAHFMRNDMTVERNRYTKYLKNLDIWYENRGIVT